MGGGGRRVTGKIATVRGRRVWDSRGRPTVEVEVALANGRVGRAIAPAGASTGSGEAVDRRDGGERFGGYDVVNAVESVNGGIARAIVGRDPAEQELIDRRLIELDGTPNKARLGGNAIIAASLAVAHAAAAADGVPLWRYLAGDAPVSLPLPEIQLFGGGAHAARRVDVQDFMIVAVGAETYPHALDMTAEVYRTAGDLLAERGKLMGVADEGGFWPAFDSNEEALTLTIEAIERAGLRPGEDVAISLDVAASELGRDGRYRLARDSRELDSGGMIELLRSWLGRYPIVSIEDPLAEDDEKGLIDFTRVASKGIQIVGDDYLVTSASRVRRGQVAGACNALLVKPNQAGTLTETKQALDAARAGGWGAIVSARSGETEDVSIVHLAVGWGVKQIKVGSFARSERMAKWNEGLRIGEAIGMELPPRSAFPWGKQDR
jgi:enolase